MKRKPLDKQTLYKINIKQTKNMKSDQGQIYKQTNAFVKNLQARFIKN